MGTSLRRVRFIRAGGSLVVAVVATLCWLFLAPFLGSPLITVALIAGVVIFGIVQYRLALRTPSGAVFVQHPDVNTLPVPERRPFMKRQLAGAAVFFPLFSLWVWKDLNLLESGAAETVRLWLPIGLIYEHLGYWPAVLVLPSMGVVVCTFWFHRLNNSDPQ